MARTLDEIRGEALTLSVEERGALADSLVVLGVEAQRDHIFVAAFAHHSRRPGYWRRRLS